ncbi:M50 family peptidase [bacterium]|nr:MAG: M50 family peptidase [bacterium]
MATDTAPVKTKTSWVKKLFGIPQDQDLVEWMIDKQNNPLSQIMALIGFIGIFWLAFRSPWGVLAVILGVYIHEIGHFLVFFANGIKSIILMLFPLGAVTFPINKEEDAKSDLLPWWDMAWLFHAGPTMNLLLMVIGLVLILQNILPEFGHQLMYINGILAVFNLLPIGNTDGGQLFNVIFSSLEEKGDKVVAFIGTSTSFAIICGILISPIGLGGFAVLNAFVHNFILIIFLVLLASGIWHKQRKDNPLYSESKQAMSIGQVVFQLGYYTCLVSFALILMTP